MYRGLFALLMARGARDWRTGKAFDEETVAELCPRFHTVFPPVYLQRMGVDAQASESVLNRTPMGRRTDVVIENNEPRRYLPRLQSKSLLDDADFDAVIEGHEMHPQYLLTSNWEAFEADRRNRFVGMIEYAMDKPVIRDLMQEDVATDHGD